MKKYLLVILSILTVIALLPLKVAANFAMADEDKISTGIFLPTSYLQYYKLVNPYAICRYEDEEGKEVVAVSHENEIVIYRDEKFVPIKLDLGGYQVKTIEHYGKYLVYVFKLGVYAIDISGFNEDDWSVDGKLKEVSGKRAYDISIANGQIAVATESDITVYDIEENDGFWFKDEATDSNVHQAKEKPNSVLLTESGKVYYSTASKIFECGNDEPIKSGVSGVCAIAADSDGKIYYSCETGVYTIDEPICEVQGGEQDLGKIYDPKGICLTGKGLWVVDAALNAVQEIDLKDNSFTQFAITTNSNAINRLSGNVKDICVDKDKIYALDAGRIVVINDIDGVNSYNKIDVSADLFAVGDGKLLTYNKAKKELRSFDIDFGGGDTLKIAETKSYGLGNVKDLCYSDGKFYVLYEKYVDSAVYPVISVFGSSDAYNNLPKGYALQITADVFGNVYYATETQTGESGNYEFYKVGGSTPLVSIEKNKNLINLQTDLDGKLYALYEDNCVECYKESEKVFSKEIKLSQNLDSVNNTDPLKAKSMCLSYNSPTAYFMFNGLILKTVNEEEMNISTPEKIKIVEDFSVKYDKDNEFCKLKAETNLFEVDKDIAGGFKYLGIEKETKDTDYSLFKINDKYSLLICEKKNYIVRNSDVISRKKATEKSEVGYAAVDFNICSVPVIEENYSQSGAKKHEKIEVLGALDFNGESFYSVRTTGGEGYIPQSFILSSLAKENEFESARSTYIYLKNGVKVFSDENLKEELKTVSEKTKVKVISQSEEVLKIDLGGEIGYVFKDAEYSDDRNNTVKAIAVILCALSVTVFALFFENKYLYRKKGSIEEKNEN